MSFTGSCLCGAVRYEVTQEPTWAQNCHCSRCRKSRGAPFASNLFVAREGFRFTEGEDQVRSYKPPEAERYTHTFCNRCGSSLPWLAASRGIVVVPMGGLDEDPGIRPRAHVFVDSKPPWFAIVDDLPQHTAALDSPAPGGPR